MASHEFPQTIFVLGTSRNVGKTVTCMGLVASLLSDPYSYRPNEIGYIKPVGQQTVTVMNGKGVPIEADKDAVLLTALMGLQSYGYERISPVVWTGGRTAQCIDETAEGNAESGREAFLERIRESYRHVCVGKRVVIVEGTGQPGVGSVAGISNGDVINALRGMGVPVFVTMVAPGGIGSTIDEVFPYLMALDHLGTRVDGIIVNGVYESKLDKIRHYIGTYYDKVFEPLYGGQLLTQCCPAIVGYVPAIPELRLPSMRMIAEHFATETDSSLEIVAPKDFDSEGCRLVKRLKVISLEFGYEPYLEPGDGIIVGVNANDVILAILLVHERMVRKHGRGLSGLILSCKHAGGLAPQIRDLVSSGDLPTITLGYDSAEIVQLIEGMTIKIQPYDEQKKRLVAEAYHQYLSLWSALDLSLGDPATG